MKVGLLAYQTDRGLGIQAWEFFRHMHPERVMVLNAGPSPYDVPEGRYPADSLHVSVGADHRLPEAKVREWLTGLDVVFAAESLPDWRMAGWAEDAGVATVVQLNPEFFRHASDGGLRHPTQWWAPTPWRLDALPGWTVVVPVPVALDRFEKLETRNSNDGPLKVLHVAGRRAIYDRNGTDLVVDACRYMEERIDLILTCQDGPLDPVKVRGKGVRVQCRPGNLANYWDLYAGFDVLVLPRRYGGLSLPTQEALAAGLAVVMPDCSPNRIWPIVGLPVGDWSTAKMPGGEIRLAAVQARKIANALDMLAADRDLLAEQRKASLAWAEANSWEALAPMYRERLAEAIYQRRAH